MNKNTKRYNFGVVLDLLPDLCSSKIRNRVTDVRDQASKFNYHDLDSTAQQLYVNRASQEAMYGVRAGCKPASFSGQKFHLLCASAGLLVLTHRFNKVKWEVGTALANGTPVTIFKPYGKPDMVKPVSQGEWELICEREVNPDWSAWLSELDYTLQFILDTPTPWLDYASLKEFANQYSDFAKFIEQVHAEINLIEAQGVWDVDTSGSVVYNEKASVAHYVANKGMDKGKRTCSSSYKYGKKEYWYNYETLPVDVLTKYLHLSYLHSIEYKPMVRIATASDDDLGKLIYTEFTDDRDAEVGLTLTPLYEDPYFDHEGEVDIAEQIPEFDSGRSCSTCDSDEPCTGCPNYR